MKKIWLGFLKALLLSAVFTLGAYAAQTKSIRDFAQRQVQIPENIRSVATLGSVGVLNCFIFAMGEGDKIANALPPRFTKTDRWKYHYKFNPALKNYPVVEDAESSIIMEELLKVRPDIVFTMDKRQADEVAKKGLNAVVLTWKNEHTET